MQASLAKGATMHQITTGKFPKDSKFVKPSDGVNISVLAICMDPSHSKPSLYEQVLGDVPPEAMDEWRNLLRSYEPPQYSAHFSKEGAKSFFADSLDNFLLSPVEDYVAASKAAAVRPKIFPDLDYFDGLVIMLNTDRQEYLSRKFLVGDSEVDSDDLFGSDKASHTAGEDACNYPDCPRGDMPCRDCKMCGSAGKHHHICASEAGQEEEYTSMCFECMQASIGLTQEDIGAELAQQPVIGSPVLSATHSERNIGGLECYEPLSRTETPVGEQPEPPSASRSRGQVPASPAQAKLLFGYIAGWVERSIPNGQCFFESIQISGYFVKLSEGASDFIGDQDVEHLKRNIAAVLRGDSSILNHAFDFRVGAPPDVDEASSTLTASITDIAREDFGTSPAGFVRLMMRSTHYGGVLESCVISACTGAIIQMGAVDNIPGSDVCVFVPSVQISPPVVDFLGYDARNIIRLVYKGCHFDGWRSRHSGHAPSPPAHISGSAQVVRRNIADAFQQDAEEVEDSTLDTMLQKKRAKPAESAIMAARINSEYRELLETGVKPNAALAAAHSVDMPAHMSAAKPVAPPAVVLSAAAVAAHSASHGTSRARPAKDLAISRINNISDDDDGGSRKSASETDAESDSDDAAPLKAAKAAKESKAKAAAKSSKTSPADKEVSGSSDVEESDDSSVEHVVSRKPAGRPPAPLKRKVLQQLAKAGHTARKSISDHPMENSSDEEAAAGNTVEHVEKVVKDKRAASTKEVQKKATEALKLAERKKYELRLSKESEELSAVNSRKQPAQPAHESPSIQFADADDVRAGSIVRFTRARKRHEGTVLKLKDKKDGRYASVELTDGTKVKARISSTDDDDTDIVRMQLLPGTGPKLLFFKGNESTMLYGDEQTVLVAWLPSEQKMDLGDLQMVGLVRSVEGMVATKDSKEDPAPRFLQQMAKGQFIVVSALSGNFPRAMDIVVVRIIAGLV